MAYKYTAENLKSVLDHASFHPYIMSTISQKSYDL